MYFLVTTDINHWGKIYEWTNPTLECAIDRVSTQTRQPPHSYLMAWYRRIRKMLYTISVIFCSSEHFGFIYPRENIQSCQTEHCKRHLKKKNTKWAPWEKKLATKCGPPWCYVISTISSYKQLSCYIYEKNIL